LFHELEHAYNAQTDPTAFVARRHTYSMADSVWADLRYALVPAVDTEQNTLIVRESVREHVGSGEDWRVMFGVPAATRTDDWTVVYKGRRIPLCQCSYMLHKRDCIRVSHAAFPLEELSLHFARGIGYLLSVFGYYDELLGASRVPHSAV
jgi:hypothetical protein